MGGFPYAHVFLSSSIPPFLPPSPPLPLPALPPSLLQVLLRSPEAQLAIIDRCAGIELDSLALPPQQGASLRAESRGGDEKVGVGEGLAMQQAVVEGGTTGAGATDVGTSGDGDGRRGEDGGSSGKWELVEAGDGYGAEKVGAGKIVRSSSSSTTTTTITSSNGSSSGHSSHGRAVVSLRETVEGIQNAWEERKRMTGMGGEREVEELEALVSKEVCVDRRMWVSE